jgi:hypothetical protein
LFFYFIGGFFMMLVKWGHIIDNNYNDCLDFVDEEISLKQFMKNVDPVSRRDLRYKIERFVGASHGRQLLKRALRRRNCI